MSFPITVKAEGWYLAVQIEIPAGFDRISLERDTRGHRTFVFGAEDAAVDPEGGAVEVKDISAIQNVTPSYRVIARVAGDPDSVVKGTWQQADEFLDFGGDLIFNPARPDLRMNLTVESLPRLTFQRPNETVWVLRRRDPVVISGTRRLPSGQMSALTFTDEERRKFLEVVALGDVVALNPWQPDFGFDEVMYFSVSEIVEERVSTKGYEPTRRWLFDLQVVDPITPNVPLIESDIFIDPTPLPPLPDPGTNPEPVNPDPDPVDPGAGSNHWNEYDDEQTWRLFATEGELWSEVFGELDMPTPAAPLRLYEDPFVDDNTGDVNLLVSQNNDGWEILAWAEKFEVEFSDPQGNIIKVDSDWRGGQTVHAVVPSKGMWIARVYATRGPITIGPSNWVNATYDG